MKVSNQKIIYCLKDSDDQNHLLSLDILKKHFLSPEVHIYTSNIAKPETHSGELANEIYRLSATFPAPCEKILLLNSDALINGVILRFLNSSKASKSVIFMEHNLKVDPDQQNIYFDGDTFSDTYSGQGYKYWGVCKLLSSKVRMVLGEQNILNIINALYRDGELEVVNINDVINSNGKYIGGGSHASSKREVIFSKQASDLGYDKLKDEIKYLTNLPSGLAGLFPKINSFSINDSSAELKLEYLPYPTLRDLIFSGEFDADDAFKIISQILKTLQQEYQNSKIPVHDDYLPAMHFDRLYKRLEQTISLSPIFKNIIEADQIIINNKQYKNIYEMAKIFEDPEVSNMFLPEYLSIFVHGDLHLENILVEPASKDFKLIDPRGYHSCDIFYDLGKLSHSTNGKYDFIHENDLKLDYCISNATVAIDMQFYNTSALQTYSKLDKMLRDFYCEIIPGNNIIEKVLFNEAMHFCSDMPFQLVYDGVESRAVAIYATGIMIFNQLIENLPKLRSTANAH
jgi:hypothetical protein